MCLNYLRVLTKKKKYMHTIYYVKLYFTQYNHCVQYLKRINISNENLYRLITVNNEVIPHILPNNLVQLPPYLLTLAYRDALVDILDERYDNIN